MPTLVSVIVPVYNSEKYLVEAVNSITGQTYNDLEIIIIDDKSTDNSLAMANKLAATDSRIKVVANEKNLGIGGNRALGIQLARGEYICWQDADDISLSDRVMLQSAYLDSHPEVGVVGGFITFFDEKGDGVTRTYKEHDAELRKTIFRYNPIAQPAAMFRKTVYDTVGGYDESYKVSEDLEMLFRAGESYEFANVQQVVLRYRQSDSSLTASKMYEMERVALMIRRKYKDSPAYNFTLIDWIFNAVQRMTMFMPASLRKSLFRIVRGDK